MANSQVHFSLDDYVESYEIARRSDRDACLEHFLPPREHAQYAQIAVELIRVDLEYRFTEGQACSLEDYRKLFNEVLQDPRHLAAVAFEEYRLRAQAGEMIDTDDYGRRLGINTSDWPRIGRPENASITSSAAVGSPGRESHSRRSPVLKQLEDIQRLLPEVGQVFQGFELVGELGRGAFGRVFLARQQDLAHRFVALKIASGMTCEADRLAQLQHSHIVPIHSLHRHGPLHAVCMPFLGSRTLADILVEFHGRSEWPTTGRELLSTIAARHETTVPMLADAKLELSSRVDSHPNQRSRNLQVLESMSYRDAVCWIMSRVADGLAHAHEHGILHRDLKPANVLLTDDGQPLILDFNISSEVNRPRAAMVGGTLPYMAPEHLESLRTGDAVVDQRSDIYSLGIILFELLAGRHPFHIPRGTFDEIADQLQQQQQAQSPRTRNINRRISRSLESIIQKCLEPDPRLRYQTARQLQEDLQCELDNLPLKYAANRSLPERLGKWSRRHPRLSSGTTVAAVAAAVVLVFLTSWYVRGRNIERLQTREQWEALRNSLPQARAMLTVIPVSEQSFGDASQAASQCFERFQAIDLKQLGEADRQQARSEVAGLYYLKSLSTFRHAQLCRDESQRKEMLTRSGEEIQRATQFYEDHCPGAVAGHYARVLSALKQDSEAARWEKVAGAGGVAGAEDAYLLAGQHLAAGHYRPAIEVLRDALLQSPRNFEYWFLLGNCLVGAGQLEEAESAFGTCVVLVPQSYAAFFHRGLVRLQRKKFAEAVQDFSRVIELHGNDSASLVNRGLAEMGQGNHDSALQDFTAAIDLGVSETRVFFLRAKVRQSLGDSAGAQQDLQRGLTEIPSDELSWIERGIHRIDSDPQAALEDFKEAWKWNPESRTAIQDIAHVLSERLQKNEEAVDWMNRLVESYPNDASVWTSRGVLQARVGARSSALDDLREAAQLKPQEAITIYQMACIRALLAAHADADPQDKPLAVQYLARALLRDPGLIQIAARDPDLEALRELGEFRQLLGGINLLIRVARPLGP